MPQKVTFETVQKIALTLPGVKASTSYGASSFKAGGKMFACTAVNKSAEPNSLMVRMDFDQRDALIAEAPDTYYLTDHYVSYPCVLVRLSKVNAEALRDLLQAGVKFVSANSKHKDTKARRHKSARS